MEMLRSVQLSLLAVDESHCISQVRRKLHLHTSRKLIDIHHKQWGASFRPEYLKIARFTEEFEIERYERSACDA